MKRKLEQVLEEFCLCEFEQISIDKRCKTRNNTHVLNLSTPNLFRLQCTLEVEPSSILPRDVMDIIFFYLSWAQRSMFFDKYPHCETWVSDEFAKKHIGDRAYHDICPLLGYKYIARISAEREYLVGEATEEEFNLWKFSCRTKENYRWERLARAGKLTELANARNIALWNPSIWEEVIRGCFERRERNTLQNLLHPHAQRLKSLNVLRYSKHWWVREDTLTNEGLQCLELIIPFCCSWDNDGRFALINATDNLDVFQRLETIFSQKKYDE